MLLEFLSIFMLIYTFAEGTLSPKATRWEKEVRKSTKVYVGPLAQTVFDRKLVSQNVSADEIINNYQAYNMDTSASMTEGMVLGYVTPVCKFYS